MSAAAELRARRQLYLPKGRSAPPETVETTVKAAAHYGDQDIPKKPPLGEIGSPGTALSTAVGGSVRSGSYLLTEEDYNPDLRGQLFFREINRMRLSDSQVKAVMSMMKLPLLAADWNIEAPTDSPEDIEIAEWTENHLFNYMRRTFQYTLKHALLSLDFGSMPMEAVFDVKHDPILNRPMVCLEKLGPRFPNTITEWRVDEHGELESIVQQTNKRGTWSEDTITADRLLCFVHDMEGANWRGTSILRQARKDWVIKERLQRINQVAIEKRASGVDVGTMDETASQEEPNRTAYEEALMSIRTHERGYLLLPSGHDYKIAGIEGQVLDPLPSIKYADIMILRSILADFLTAGSGGEGSYNLVKDRTSFYLMSLLGVAKEIVEPFNRYLIPKWVQWNWPNVKEFPQLVHSRLDRRDVAALATALKDLIPAGVITPDSELEKEVRDLLDLPRLAAGEELPAPGEEDAPPMDDLLDPEKGPEAFKRLRQGRRGRQPYEIKVRTRNYEDIRAHMPGKHSQDAHGRPGVGVPSPGEPAKSGAAVKRALSDDIAKSTETRIPGMNASSSGADVAVPSKYASDQSTAIVSWRSHTFSPVQGRAETIARHKSEVEKLQDKLTSKGITSTLMEGTGGAKGASNEWLPHLRVPLAVKASLDGSEVIAAGAAVDFRVMASLMDTAEDEITRIYEGIQKKQIDKVVDEAVKAIAKGDPDALEEVNVPFKREAADAILTPLIDIYRGGQREVRKEMARMGFTPIRMSEPLDPENDLAVKSFLKARSRMIASSLAERLRGSVMRNGMDMIRDGKTDRLTLQGSLTTLSNRVIKSEAKLSVSEALNLGRESIARQNAAVVAGAEYSAIMDDHSCHACKDMDGRDFVYGSRSYQEAAPPYHKCEGRSKCRCVMIFTFASEGDVRGARTTNPKELELERRKGKDGRWLPGGGKGGSSDPGGGGGGTAADPPAAPPKGGGVATDPKSFAQQVGGDPTMDRALATYQYSSSPVNNALRNDPSKLSPEQRKNVEKLDEATQAGALAEDKSLYRGMRVSEDRFKAMQSAGGFEDKAFSSTSFSSDVARDFAWSDKKDGMVGVFVTVKAPAGTKGAYMENTVEGAYRRQKEFLLPRGSKFKIEDIAWAPGGYVVEVSLAGR